MSKLVKSVRNWAIGLSAAAIISMPIHSYFASNTITTVVNDTEVKRYGESDKYLVFTDDGVFQNTDAWYRLKFSSSDLQGKIKKLKGKSVDITAYGWRIPLTSTYPNIVDVVESKETD